MPHNLALQSRWGHHSIVTPEETPHIWVVVAAVVEPAHIFGELRAKGTRCAAFDEFAVPGVDEGDSELCTKSHRERIKL
jgi:hypothetical protein